MIGVKVSIILYKKPNNRSTIFILKHINSKNVNLSLPRLINYNIRVGKDQVNNNNIINTFFNISFTIKDVNFK